MLSSLMPFRAYIYSAMIPYRAYIYTATIHEIGGYHPKFHPMLSPHVIILYYHPKLSPYFVTLTSDVSIPYYGHVVI
jgi:hypothetical protein